jgi:hypothetical protein
MTTFPDINTVPKLTDAAFPSISGPIPLQRAVIYGTHMSSKILLKLSEHASALRHLDLGVTNYFNLENMGDNLGQLTQIDNVTIKYCQDPGSVGRLVALWKEKGVAPSFIGSSTESSGQVWVSLTKYMHRLWRLL